MFFSGVVIKCTYSTKMEVTGSSPPSRPVLFCLNFRQKKGAFESRSHCGVLKSFTNTSLKVKLMHSTMC